MIRGHNKACRKNWKLIYGGYYCKIHDKFIDFDEVDFERTKKIGKNEGKTCLYCSHLKDLLDSSCSAFPIQIPCPFLYGIEVHKKRKYGQKNGIIFSPRLSCPICKSKNTIPIIYGHPTQKTVGLWLRGEVQINSGKISEKYFDRFCKDCQNDFLAGKEFKCMVQ